MSGPLKTHQKLLIGLVTLVTAMALLAVGVYAYDKAQEDQIAPGVKVGGVNIGGRSVEDARDVIDEELVAPLQKPVVVDYEGETYKLSPRRLDQRSDVDEVLEEAQERSREGGLVERIGRYLQGSSVNVNLEPRISYNEAAIDRFVEDIAERVNREPVDASIEPSGDELIPTRHESGLALDEDDLRDAVVDEVETAGAGDPVQPEVAVTQPEITTKELASEYPTYITVSQSEYKLRLFRNLKLVRTYPIAVGGSGYPTPTGLHSIQDKQVDPTWNVPESSWAGSLAGQSIPPGPSNPLKERWMGIYNGAGIHGTDDTGSIGSSASHGCIRMLIPDVIELFDKVEVGDPIYIQ